MKLHRAFTPELSEYRRLFGASALSCMYLLSSQALAKSNADERLLGAGMSTSPEIYAAHQSSRTSLATRISSFDTTCNAFGRGILSVGLGGYAAKNELDRSPDLANCLVFGNQDQGHYICLCSDRDEAVSGKIDAEEIPTLDEGVGSGIEPSPIEPKYVKEFEDMCLAKFNSACGPFPERVEASCSDGRSRCEMRAIGTQRDSGHDFADGRCYCEDGSSWTMKQRFEESFSPDEATVQAQCEASLTACSTGTVPEFAGFQNKPGAAFSMQRVDCRGYTPGKTDECWIRAQGSESPHLYECDCRGNTISGEIDVMLEQSARDLYASCEALLEKCEEFEPNTPKFPGFPPAEEAPDIDDQNGQDDSAPEIGEGGDVPDKGQQTPLQPAQDIERFRDVVEKLGCQTIPHQGSGFGSGLGFLALALLSGFRRYL